MQLKLPNKNTTTVYGRSGAYLDSTYVERAPSDMDNSRNMNTSSEWWVITYKMTATYEKVRMSVT
jgi:hypothetical protein